MNDSADTFPVIETNRVRRLFERGRYDKAGTYGILDAAMICHMSYFSTGNRYARQQRSGGDRLYWHGSSASRMLRAQRPGLPVCLTVTYLGSLVLARCGFNHSVDYRSAMCFGSAHIIDDPKEKVRAPDRMIDRFYPERAAKLRRSTAQELKATMLIGMTIENASGKIRAKGVADEEKDYALPIYAARIPVRTVIGEIEPCPRLPAGVPRPDGLDGVTAGRRLDDILLETYSVVTADSHS